MVLVIMMTIKEAMMTIDVPSIERSDLNISLQ
jgi:hypothetical protein